VNVLVGIGSAFIAALGAYFAASRRLSGKIGTSEAAQLWSESQAMRADYRSQIATANERTLSLEHRVANLERDNNALVRENLELGAKVREYEQTIAELRGQLETSKEEIAELRACVASLQETLQARRGGSA
jgi:chromosome segregation ATPase